MTRLALTTPPLTGRRLLVIGQGGHAPYESALRDAGATLTCANEIPAEACALPGPGAPDAVVLVSHGDPRDMVAARALRDSGFEGLLFAVVPAASPEAATRWAFLGRVDDCVSAPAHPSELAGLVADQLIRSRNATLGKLSPFAPGLDDLPTPDLAEEAVALECV